MKSQKKELSKSQYPTDYKEVFNNYLLKNEIIQKYNNDENNILKGKKHENYE